ncbi:MAG: hypothetical protein WCV90_04245 [Candidatus Woesearchaeota archaeon]
MDRRTFLGIVTMLSLNPIQGLTSQRSDDSFEHKLTSFYEGDVSREELDKLAACLRSVEDILEANLPLWLDIKRQWYPKIKDLPKIWDYDNPEMYKLGKYNTPNQRTLGALDSSTNQIYLGEMNPKKHLKRLLSGRSLRLEVFVHEGAHYFVNSTNWVAPLWSLMERFEIDVLRSTVPNEIIIQEQKRITGEYDQIPRLGITISRNIVDKSEIFLTEVKKAYQLSSREETARLLKRYDDETHGQQFEATTLDEINSYFAGLLVYAHYTNFYPNPKQILEYILKQCQGTTFQPFDKAYRAVTDMYSLLLLETKGREVLKAVEKGSMIIGESLWSYHQESREYAVLERKVSEMTEQKGIKSNKIPRLAQKTATMDHTKQYQSQVRRITLDYLQANLEI